MYPDIESMMRKVRENLDQQALMLEITQSELTQYFRAGQAIYFSDMSAAADLAWGISKSRFDQVTEQAIASLPADKLNLSLQYLGDIQGIDLGDEFKEDPIGYAEAWVLSLTVEPISKAKQKQ